MSYSQISNFTIFEHKTYNYVLLHTINPLYLAAIVFSVFMPHTYNSTKKASVIALSKKWAFDVSKIREKQQ